MKVSNLLNALIIAVALCELSNAQSVEQIVKWSATVPAQQTVQGGTEVNALVSAEIAEGWHVYAITQAPGGPTAMSVTVPASQPFCMVAKAAGTKPLRKFDQNFEMETEFYEKSLNVTVPLLVDAHAAGPQKVRIDVRFQTCNETICLPPTTMHLEAALTVGEALTPQSAKSQTEKDGLGVGAQVPEFTFTDFDGRARKFSEFRGKFVLIDFWATWCKPCLADIPKLKELYAKYQTRGFEIIGMDSETLGQEGDAEFAKEAQERASQLVKTRGVIWTQATPDTAVPVAVKIFGVESLPSKFLIDREGKIAARVKDTAELDQLLEMMPRTTPNR